MPNFRSPEMSLIEVPKILTEIPFFNPLKSEHLLRSLRDNMKYRIYLPSANVYQRASEGKLLYIVTSGVVSLEPTDPREAVKNRRIEAGGYFGRLVLDELYQGRAWTSLKYGSRMLELDMDDLETWISNTEELNSTFLDNVKQMKENK